MTEELQEVVELPVEVAAERDGGVDHLDVVLLHEEVTSAEAELVDGFLRNHLGASQGLDDFLDVKHGEKGGGGGKKVMGPRKWLLRRSEKMSVEMNECR